MSEETTDNLSERNSFETQVLTALATLGARMSALETKVNALEEKVDSRMTALEVKVDALEEKVDARLRETRPIWEAVLARVELIDGKLDILNHDMLTMRAEVDRLKKRQPPAA